MTFERDPAHWLFRFSPQEWVRAGLGDIKRAEEAYRAKNGRAGLAGARRGAGMALNGVLICEPDELWGRSYVDHLQGLARTTAAPEAVRYAARLLLDTPLPGGAIVSLRTASSEERLLEAARDVAAHAWVVVGRHIKEAP